MFIFVPCRREDEDWQEEEYGEDVMTPNTNFDNRSNSGQGPMAGMKGNMPPGDPNQGRGQFNQGPMRQRDGMGNSAPPGNMNMPPNTMGPKFRNDSMNSGGMMPGNMGPGGRNAPPGNFGNINSGNFGGMNNMPFPGPDQRNVGPPGPMNNPPRFQGNQGTDILKNLIDYQNMLYVYISILKKIILFIRRTVWSRFIPRHEQHAGKSVATKQKSTRKLWWTGEFSRR